MVSRTLSRRRFLEVAGLATSVGITSACARATAPAPPPPLASTPVATEAATVAPTAAAPTEAPTTPPAKYKEAPMLAELVKAGKLPPVEERLPKEPMVVTPWQNIGKYGGTWRSGLLGKSDRPWISRTMAYEALLRWNPDLTGVIPNIAKGWEVSADGTEFTFYLREGMKWSDGHPFTADDFVFWYEDVVSNDELTKVKPLFMKSGGELGAVEKVDDVTVKFKFSRPNGLFLYYMAYNSPFVPAHYAKKWHVKYNKQEVEKAVAELKMQDWVALYQAKMDWLDNPECPTLFAWRVVVPVGSGTQVVAERNPYYWKVDPEGNQLPYIDKCVYPIVEKVEVLVMKALAGEVDMMDRHIATPDNKAVFMDNKEKGGYDFFTVKYAWESPCVIALNLNHPDPVLREIFMKKEFRVALSHAINRQELIDTIYVGDGQPRQPAPLEESPHFHEELAYQFLDYDLAKANKLLDELGLERGADGIRMRPDGKPIYFTIEVIAAFEPWAQIMELVSNYWKEVGISTTVKTIDRSLFYQRKAAYEHECMVWTGADGIFVLLDPRWYMPYSIESIYGVAWADWWNSSGAIGQEPPEPAKRQQELFDELRTKVSFEDQKAIMRKVLDIAAEQFWCIGTTRYYAGYGIVKNNFKNVPKELWQWHLSSSPAQTNPEQYYIES